MSVNLNVNTLKSTLSQITRGVNFVDFEAEVILVGGGGRGGLYVNSSRTGTGGGAGSFISASFLIPATSSLFVQVGEGGSGSLSGTTFTFFPAGDSKITYGPSGSVLEELFIAPGGGVGDSAPTLDLSDVTVINGVSTDGGSGGGKRNYDGTQNKSGSISIPATIPDGTGLRPAEVYGYPRTGSASSVGIYDENEPLFPQFAGGGGVNGTGSVADSRNEEDSIGAGISLIDTFLSGSLVNNELAQGGRILWETADGNGVANTGQGGGYIGGSGLVAIKYSGEQKIFGDAGQVQTIEDYTIHIFTSSADITTTGKTFSGSDVDKPTPLIEVQALVAGGGGGRGFNGGGGGAGALVTSSFTLGRNVTYEIVVGDGGVENQNGGQSYLYGFEDTSSAAYSSGSTPYTMSAEGGFCGVSSSILATSDGGDSGQGYIYKNDIIVQTFPSYSGGVGYGGGGASVKQNGQDGTPSAGGLGGEYVGGTILYPWYKDTPTGTRGDSFVGGGGNGIGRGNSNTFNDPAFGASYDTGSATKGAVVIQYPQYYDFEDIVVTGNATASLYNGNRTWLFGVGTSSLTLNFNPTAST